MITPTMRPLQASDLPEVLEIERITFPTPWSEVMFTDEIDAPGRRYLVAVADGTIVAYGGIMIVDGDAHVMNLAVVPDHRRHGIASRMLLALVDDALGLGASHLTLELRVTNAAARALYDKFGFAPVGLRPAYYGDEDALVMWALDADRDEYASLLDSIREEIR